ncbi:excalibur calcium-binding domain-containing protein [Mycolicibacterium alvei]|uniref:Calcium-binding protein n=1 Tax=Mycolicibacterium alvei TaxID=67081 RepID=A0A6N4UL26_9MYCO|nr:excalibur calcium-binding domain-containing protein [Mycolicibacterium alvei]MCV7002653.1 excalibur calcium-binding domain-containing protein [Mycolicibacterium alvei]BBX25079.1 calcium-binding protein [Mycolicibacterium alvei]
MVRVVILAAALIGGAIGVAPAAQADPPYRYCKDAYADGKANMTKDDPGYADHLDRDGDGIACEKKS